ncbi:TPA: GNAT family N-acetyltransferase [Candidatus Woesearchaeota archaeon]|nr:GNAT family N-acetyltransferase [Candidatus Woesearchaeota archaeon]
MDIRTYKDGDFPELERLLKATRLFQPEMDKRDVLFDKILASPGSIVVGEEDGNIVACVYFVHDPWCSSIFHLAVHPAHQRRRLGTQMLHEAEKRLQERGARSVGVYVEALDATEFYRKNGYDVFAEYTCMEKVFQK